MNLRDLRAVIDLWRDNDTHQIKLFFGAGFDFNKPDRVIEIDFADRYRVHVDGLDFTLTLDELVISDEMTAIRMPPFSTPYLAKSGKESRCVFGSTHDAWVTGEGSKTRLASSTMSDIEIMRMSHGW